MNKNIFKQSLVFCYLYMFMGVSPILSITYSIFFHPHRSQICKFLCQFNFICVFCIVICMQTNIIPVDKILVSICFLYYQKNRKGNVYKEETKLNRNKESISIYVCMVVFPVLSRKITCN